MIIHFSVATKVGSHRRRVTPWRQILREDFGLRSNQSLLFESANSDNENLLSSAFRGTIYRTPVPISFSQIK